MGSHQRGITTLHVLSKNQDGSIDLRTPISRKYGEEFLAGNAFCNLFAVDKMKFTITATKLDVINGIYPYKYFLSQRMKHNILMEIIE